MAIIFAKSNKKQIYSIIILGILVIIFIALMVLMTKPSKKVISFTPEAMSLPEINFSVLENSILLKLESYPATPEITDTIGRADPFATFTATIATSTKK